MDFNLSEQSEQFRKQFRAWLKDNLKDEWKASNIDKENIEEVGIQWGRKLFEGGWTAPTWPKEYGGLALTMEQYLVYLQELVLADAPEEINSNAIGVFGPTFIRFGTEEQKRRYLPKMLSHEELWCQGFSEPNAGSDLAGLKTRAEKKGNKYILNGQKTWTTHAHHADKCYILVRTDFNAPKHQGISMMIMDMHQPGVTVRPLKNMMGTIEFDEVFLEDAIVDENDVIGEINQGWQLTTNALANERGTRMAHRALRMGQELQDLVQLYKELGNNGTVQTFDVPVEERLVDAFITSEVVRSASMRNMMLINEGNLPGVFPPMVKLTWSEAQQEMVNLAVEMLGEEALIEDGQYKRWMDSFLWARAATIYAGTSEIQRNIIAKGLGLPSSRGDK